MATSPRSDAQLIEMIFQFGVFASESNAFHQNPRHSESEKNASRSRVEALIATDNPPLQLPHQASTATELDDFYQRCKSRCQRALIDLDSCFQVGFAASAALKVIYTVELLNDPERARRLSAIANRYIDERNIIPHPTETPASPSPLELLAAAGAQRLASLDSPQNPDSSDAVTSPSPPITPSVTEVYELDPGDTISYTHVATNTTRECILLDFGSSRAKGDWFIILDSVDGQRELSAAQMRDEIMTHFISASRDCK